MKQLGFKYTKKNCRCGY